MFCRGNRFVHERLGWNLRMTNIQAALGVAQLEKLDEFLEKSVGLEKFTMSNFQNYLSSSSL